MMLNYRLALIDAYKLALNYSEDPVTQVAAVLYDQHDDVIADGWNEFPARISPRWQTPEKYDYIEHAERNAIFCAARLGVPTMGSTMVCTWGPCISCARAIIQAGVKSFVTHLDCVNYAQEHGRNWNDLSIAHAMMREAGLRVVSYEGRLCHYITIRHSGGLFQA